MPKIPRWCGWWPRQEAPPAATTPAPESCKTCRFWRPFPGWVIVGDREPRYGWCGRHAPVLSTDPLTSAGRQPETGATFWCGDWEAKKEQDHGNR